MRRRRKRHYIATWDGAPCDAAKTSDGVMRLFRGPYPRPSYLDMRNVSVGAHLFTSLDAAREAIANTIRDMESFGRAPDKIGEFGLFIAYTKEED